MAQIDWVDGRLREWGAWRMVGDGSGYSAMSPLHPDWSPPSPGTTPTMKVAPPSSARATDAVIRAAVEQRQLSQRLADTLVLHYCTTLSNAEQAQRLGCQAAAVPQRVRVAHAVLAKLLT